MTLQNHKVLLTVGSGSNAISYDLYEARANEKKADLQRALFYFAENCSELEKRLAGEYHENLILKNGMQY